MNTAPLRDLLAANLGLDVETTGPSFLQRVAARSLAESGYSDLQTLVRAAAAGGEAWRIVLEHVVVPETWFFRDRVPFEHLAGVARALWRGPGRAPVRILSCPCSTGEEAYSIAIALDEAGLSPDACTIDAADVSLRALNAARAGVFGPRSFRGELHGARARYFDHQPGSRQWVIKPAYRAMVQFRPANLVSLEGIEHVGQYDVVLCRNLLIYLHAEARARVMTTLRQLLVPGGLLIVGHAEAAIAVEHGFKKDGNSAAFAFVKTERPVAVKRPAPAPGRRAPAKRHDAVEVAKSHPHGKTKAVRAGGEPAPTGMEVTLERIRELGDRGRVEEAILACRDYLRRTPDSADAYFLLGLLCGALGHDDAASTALRRALYLQPDHAAALVHLALAQDASGEADRARAGRGRSSPTSRNEG